jgi:hypothetical protein
VTVETDAQNLERALKSRLKWLLILIVVIFLNAIGLVIL